MSCGHNLNMGGAPSVHCYADALKVWEESTPWITRSNTPEWRTRGDNERPISNSLRAHKQKSIVKRGVIGAIAFRYHNTDVITYFPDDTIEIDPYNSMTTDTFVSYFLPEGISAHFSQGAICVFPKGESYGWQSGRYYRTYDTMHLRRIEGDFSWEVTDPRMWEKRRPDREKMRVACKEWGYDLFRDSGPAFFALQGCTDRAFHMPSYNEALTAMRGGPAMWDLFVYTGPAQHRANRYRAFDSTPPFVFKTILDKLRHEICRVEKAYTIEQSPFVVGYHAWQRVRFREF